MRPLAIESRIREEVSVVGFFQSLKRVDHIRPCERVAKDRKGQFASAHVRKSETQQRPSRKEFEVSRPLGQMKRWSEPERPLVFHDHEGDRCQ